jgi:hypothetical protein
MRMKYLQWSNGGLDIGAMLLVIENSTPEEDDKNMQKGVSSLDACSQISLFSLRIVES